VLYVLHGYTHTLAGEPVPNPHMRWLLGPFGTVAIDSLIHLRALRELIIVVPNATSRYGAGTFYTNSAAAGQWATFITRDLVGYVDQRYRTLARSASRGIAGGSGGGYGAFKLAMKRPDLFGAVYAQSPCCLGTAALAYDEQAWRAALRLTRPDQVPDAAHPQAMLLLGLAAAFSPDPHRPPFFVTWPFELVSGVRRPAEPAYSRWLANLPLEVLPRYASNLRRLRGIAFDVGRADQYAFIPITCRELDRALTAIGVPHVFEEYEGDHTNRRGERTVTRLLPFFEATLAFGDSAQKRGRAN
jgi:S-formylglutathione hydrolase